MNCRAVIDIIFDKANFVINNKEKNEAGSFYKIIETQDTVYIIRLSNHKSYCQNWLDRQKKRYADKKIERISIVIEDEDTKGSSTVDTKLKHPIEVKEYVFKNYETPLEIFEAHRIANAINDVAKGKGFVNPVTNKCAEPILVKSENLSANESFNGHILSFDEFNQLNETKQYLVSVSFGAGSKSSVKREDVGNDDEESMSLWDLANRPWGEREHFVQIDDNKYVWDGAQQKYLVKGLEQYGEMRETQWFVHENGTIVSFRNPKTHEYIFAETKDKFTPLDRGDFEGRQWERDFTKLDVIPEWVLKHFSILEFANGVDIDDWH